MYSNKFVSLFEKCTFTYSGAKPLGDLGGAWHSHFNIKPNQDQKFQFQPSGILLFTDVQKLYGPEISQLLPCMLQYLDNLRYFL